MYLVIQSLLAIVAFAGALWLLWPVTGREVGALALALLGVGWLANIGYRLLNPLVLRNQEKILQGQIATDQKMKRLQEQMDEALARQEQAARSRERRL